MKTLLTALTALMLAACGGSDPALIGATGRSDAQGGNDTVGAKALAAPLIGPDIDISREADATVCLSGLWVQKLRYVSSISWELYITMPNGSRKSTGLMSTALTPAEIGFTHCERIHFPAGVTHAQAQMKVYAKNQASEPADSLLSFSMMADWTIAFD